MTKTTVVGILYPGHSAEDDYPLLEQRLGGVRLPLVHTELKPSDDHTPGAMKAAGARQLASHKPDAVVWVCTSGSFAWGWDEALVQTYRLRLVAGVQATSTSFAFVAAAHELGVRRVAVAATYPAELAALFETFLARGDIEVVQLTPHDVLTAAAAGAMGREEVLKFVTASDHPAADAVLVPDTALHTVAWLDELESAAGKPVLTANQVSVWQGLRMAGDDVPRHGLGLLFRGA